MDKDFPSFFRDDDFKQDLARYEKMRNGGKAVYLDGDQLSDIAEYYASNDQYDKAIEAMDYAIQLHPGNQDLLSLKGSLLFESGDIEEARKLAAQITAPSYPALYLKAGLLIKDNDLKEAERYLRAMIYNEDEADEDSFLDAAYLYMDNGYPQESLKWFEKALEVNPWNATTQKDYAESCYRSNNLDRAIQWYNKVLDKQPYSTECWFGLAKAHSLKEDYAEALNALDFVLAIESNHQPGILLKAHICFELQNYEAASKFYAQYTEKHPTESYPFYMLGECFFYLGKTSEALPPYERGMQLAPVPDAYTIDIFHHIAFCYIKSRQAGKALATIERIIRNNGGNEPDAYILKGGACLMAGQYREAEQAFRQALATEHFRNPETYLRIALTYVNNQYIDVALNIFKLMEEKFPDYGSSAICISYLYLLKKDAAACKKYFKRAMEKDPKLVEQFMDEHLEGLPDIKRIYAELKAAYEAKNTHS